MSFMSHKLWLIVWLIGGLVTCYMSPFLRETGKTFNLFFLASKNINFWSEWANCRHTNSFNQWRHFCLLGLISFRINATWTKFIYRSEALSLPWICKVVVFFNRVKICFTICTANDICTALTSNGAMTISGMNRVSTTHPLIQCNLKMMTSLRPLRVVSVKSK